MPPHSFVVGNLLKDNQYGILTVTYGGFLFPYAIPPTGSLVYGNNFINNSYSAFNSGNEGASIGQVARWDNGSMGNYWSDYNGQGIYVIDQKNIDNHPLSTPVDISKFTIESLADVISSTLAPTITPTNLPTATITPTAVSSPTASPTPPIPTETTSHPADSQHNVEPIGYLLPISIILAVIIVLSVLIFRRHRGQIHNNT